MSDPTLSELAAAYESDKWGPHSYTRHYETHFAPFRHRPVNILEIGIGGYNDPMQGGASLRMWHDYFPHGRIFGLDLHAKLFPVADRISIFQGSQTDAALLRRIEREAGGFDIVIDDGSHLNDHVITTFNVLFPLLKQDGLYVVEDTQTSYWPILGGSSTEPDSPRTMMGYFKGLIHGLNHAEQLQDVYQAAPFDRTILSLSFYHNMIFIGKGDNSEPSNVGQSDPLRQT